MPIRTCRLGAVVGLLALGLACGEGPRAEVEQSETFVIDEVRNVQNFVITMQLDDVLPSIAAPRLEVDFEIGERSEGAEGIVVVEVDGEDQTEVDLPEVSSTLSLGDVLRCGQPPCSDRRGLRIVLVEAGSIDGRVTARLSAAEGAVLSLTLIDESAL